MTYIICNDTIRITGSIGLRKFPFTGVEAEIPCSRSRIGRLYGYVRFALLRNKFLGEISGLALLVGVSLIPSSAGIMIAKINPVD